MSLPAGVEQPDLQPWFVTFGVQYSYQPHPSGETWIHPDGWLEIYAPDENTARLMAQQIVGNAWAFIYDRHTLRLSFFPRGPLARLAPIALPQHDSVGMHQRALDRGATVLHTDDLPDFDMTIDVLVEDGV